MNVHPISPPGLIPRPGHARLGGLPGFALGLLLALAAGLTSTAPAMAAVAPGLPASLAAAPARPGFDPFENKSATLHQFSGGGHVLGFAPGYAYVASGSHALKVEFVGANPVAPQSDTPGGDGQGQAAPALAEVRYPGLWDGVDLRYRAAPGGIAESVWTLAPGADIAKAKLRYNRPLALNPDGSLRIRFETGTLTESAPVAWQDKDGQRLPVAVAFALQGERELGFTLGAHDPSLPVQIDPTLSGKETALLPLPPLRTVLESFPSHGSSLI